MAMSNTDGDDACEQIQISGSLVVKQVLHVALVQQQGFRVEQRGSGGQLRLPSLNHCVVGYILDEDTIQNTIKLK